MKQHPSGRPMRPTIVKRVRQPLGTYTGFMTARLNTSLDQLAGGCGFPITSSLDVAGTWIKR